MFAYESIVGRVMSRVFDLLVLNVFFVITSLPVITIGASLSALGTVLMEATDGDDSSFYLKYFRVFKENFKYATGAWGVFLFLAFLLKNNLQLIKETHFLTQFLVPLTIFFLMMLAIYVIYFFPLLGRLKNGLVTTVKNTFFLSIGFFPYTLLMLALSCGPIVLSLKANSVFYGMMVYFYLIIGFALTSYLNAIILNRVLHKVTKMKEVVD